MDSKLRMMQIQRFGMDLRIKREIEPKDSGLIKNLGRVERIIKLVAFLQKERTYKEICSHVGISYKTATRYINTLVQLGFKVVRIFDHPMRYRITNTAEVFNLTRTN